MLDILTVYSGSLSKANLITCKKKKSVLYYMSAETKGNKSSIKNSIKWCSV